eukprot:447488-Pyramimonas_sp.AAC.1
MLARAVELTVRCEQKKRAPGRLRRVACPANIAQRRLHSADGTAYSKQQRLPYIYGVADTASHSVARHKLRRMQCTAKFAPRRLPA